MDMEDLSEGGIFNRPVQINLLHLAGPKVIHDLLRKGYLERTGRGVYRAIEPEEFILGIADNEMDYAFLEEVGKNYAFCENTAVSIWTDGYYWTGFTRGFMPVHMAVRGKDLPYWKNFFKKKGISYSLEGNAGPCMVGFMFCIQEIG